MVGLYFNQQFLQYSNSFSSTNIKIATLLQRELTRIKGFKDGRIGGCGCVSLKMIELFLSFRFVLGNTYMVITITTLFFFATFFF